MHSGAYLKGQDAVFCSFKQKVCTTLAVALCRTIWLFKLVHLIAQYVYVVLLSGICTASEVRVSQHKLTVGSTTTDSIGDLRKTLSLLGLGIENVASDGNCMYEALARQLTRLERHTTWMDVKKVLLDFIGLNPCVTVSLKSAIVYSLNS